MCFDNDYDWCASVSEVTEGPAEKKCRCEECYSVIEPGQWRKHIWQQEHEECQCDACQEAEGTSPDCVPSYGETYDCNICHACVKMLDAVRVVEVSEGCPAYAQQPAFGELWESLREISDAEKYIAKAREMYPELESHQRFQWLVEDKAEAR